MLSVLVTATLVYLAVLVGVLAVGLLLIAAWLHRAANALGEVEAALGKVVVHTKPLGTALEQIDAAVAVVAGSLEGSELAAARVRDVLAPSRERAAS